MNKKQRNLCVNILKKEKRNYYNNLNLKVFENNKKFWKSIKPLFSDKQKLLERNIVIMEDKNIFSDNAEVAEKLNNFFIDAFQSLENRTLCLRSRNKRLRGGHLSNYKTI